MSSHSSHTTTDHNEIRRWAEARRAKPARVKSTGGNGDPGMIRLDFPGYSGSDSLQDISWDEWFRAFDENNLALVYQEQTSDGERSNFNKLVSRENADSSDHGSSDSSRQHGSHDSSRSESSSRSRGSSHRETAHASGSDESSLEQREYRDENGEVHHHTRAYMEEHKNDSGRQ